MSPSVPYGLWPSPITPLSLSQGKRLSDLAWDTDSETLVWLEGRSDRGVLVCSDPQGDAPRDLTSDLNVRARVGYGGGDMAAAQGRVLFSAEGRLYAQPLAHGAAKPITPAFGDAASPSVSPDGRWIVYVHSHEDVDCLAIVDADGSLWPQRLVTGDDFYMQPTWHPHGNRIAWVSWNHPNMPWDGGTLQMTALNQACVGPPSADAPVIIAGGADVAVSQPTFSPDGRYLAYVSDESGWDNLHLYDLQTGTGRILVKEEAEAGLPAWRQGVRTIAWSPDSSLIYYRRSAGASSELWVVDATSGESGPVSLFAQYTEIAQIAVSPKGTIASLVSAPKIPARIAVGSPTAMPRVVARAATENADPELLCQPEAITWPAEDGQSVHGLMYLPSRPGQESPGKPPLVVTVHGGPTGQSTTRYSGQAQFLTTRGYAVLDLNYRGSAGYGRIYRNLLRGTWGLYDADDAVSGAQALADQGRVDPDKLVIMGGSAGGYTVLQALIRYPGVFRAGVCLYGVTNLFTLAADTHKFEQHYLDSMIGPLPESAAAYRDRSPVFHAERIRDPVAVFQGEDDRVVPVAQAETIVEALRRQGVPHEYHLYPGEGHGWRKSETIEAFYSTLVSFLRQYVLFA